MTTTLYGISNCDTVKKAQKWLIQNNISYVFHDYRKNGLDEILVQSFLKNISWTELLNKRSTSYRQLDEQQKASLNENTIINFLITYPTLIKRPLIIHDSKYQLGFKINDYQDLFFK